VPPWHIAGTAISYQAQYDNVTYRMFVMEELHIQLIPIIIIKVSNEIKVFRNILSQNIILFLLFLGHCAGAERSC
jgi:hypothetical protein